MPLTRSSREADLMALFQRHGFVPSDVPILQPAEPFIELSGEDIRRRLFLVSDGAAEETCLRPEFTIPAARAYIAHALRGRADFAFVGPVFRQRVDAPGEFVQAGLESFGRNDRAEADADMLALAIETEASLGGSGLTIRIGDVGLSAALLTALDLPAAVVRRLRQRGLDTAARSVGGAGPNGLAAYKGVLSALKGADPAEARAFVKDLLSIAGLKAVGGRTPAEIADRFLEKAEDGEGSFSAEQADVLARFSAIAGTPDAVAVSLRNLAGEARLPLHGAIDTFEARTAAMKARGVDLARLQASTAFARNLDYYTGFVFEFVAPGRDRPAIAGGRYDNLLRRLGAAEDCPAVGCAIWLERFEA